MTRRSSVSAHLNLTRLFKWLVGQMMHDLADRPAAGAVQRVELAVGQGRDDARQVGGQRRDVGDPGVDPVPRDGPVGENSPMG